MDDHEAMTRTGKLPLLLVALLVLSVGVVGTATASDTVGKLTASKVKKIAKKVVQKQAPKLSVANAGNLNGKPATAYQDDVTVYTSSFAATTITRTITIPLAPGNYQIGYSILMSGGSGYSYCQVRRQRTSPANLLLVADDTADTLDPSVSAVGVVDVLAGDVVRLDCYSATAFGTPPGQPAQIIVEPLDSVTTGTPLTASKGTAGRPS